jgi:uncharacterized membrane protein
MWSKQLLGTDVYHIVSWFILYSMLGWVVESIYMSFCNRKITNRGFAKGPFCPIYGFGALGAYFILEPVASHYVLLYISGAILATAFEYLVAKLMLKVLGEVWWDYNDKPCNYKGLICLESTIAWGFYTLFLFRFLQNFVINISDKVSLSIGLRVCKIVLVVFVLDFGCQLARALKNHYSEKIDKVKDTYGQFKRRFY